LVEKEKEKEKPKEKELWLLYHSNTSKRNVLTRAIDVYPSPTSFTVFFDKEKRMKGRIEYFLGGELVAILNLRLAEVKSVNEVLSI